MGHWYVANCPYGVVSGLVLILGGDVNMVVTREPIHVGYYFLTRFMIYCDINNDNEKLALWVACIKLFKINANMGCPCLLDDIDYVSDPLEVVDKPDDVGI
jgi:hypothetical protein